MAERMFDTDECNSGYRIQKKLSHVEIIEHNMLLQFRGLNPFWPTSMP